MIYLLFSKQTPPPGHLERAVFLHPGTAQEVHQFAAQLIGKAPAVPYEIANLMQQPRTATLYCQQVRPMPVGAAAARGGGGAILQDQTLNGFGPRDVPGDLRAVRPDDAAQHNITPSALGGSYGAVPADIMGDLV